MATILPRRYLKADGAAARTGGALMEPVAVGVQAVLDMVFAYHNTKSLCQLFGFLPSLYLQE